MGNPFKGKKRTYVSASVVPVIDNEEYLPEALKQAVIRSVFNERTVGENIVHSVLNSPLQRFEKGYRFAQADYFYGAPDTTTQIRNINSDDVKAIIEAETGRTITLEYLDYGPLNHVFYGWFQLDSYDYDPGTNLLGTLTATKGTPVYLNDIIPIYRVDEDEDPVAGYWVEFGDSATNGKTPNRTAIADALGHSEAQAIRSEWATSSVEEGVRISYVWEENGELVGESVDFVLPDTPDVEEAYFMAKYSYVDTGTTYFVHWFYKDGEGTYPTLDSLFDASYLNPGTYFPFVPFRKDFQDMTDSSLEETQEFKDCKKMTNFLGIDYQAMGTEINNSPDIDDVIDGTLLMGVPTLNAAPVEAEYLYEFFLRWWIRDFDTDLDYNELSPTNSSVNGKVDNLHDSRFAITFADAGTEFILTCGDVIRKTKAGTLGAIGHVESTTVESSYDYPTKTNVGTFKEPKYEWTTSTQKIQNLVIKKQVHSNVYEEITVINPILDYKVYKKYRVAAKVNQNTFFIPLDRSIAKTLSRKKREELYYRSLRFVFTAKKTVKEKWYETGIFKAVVTIVSIVIIVVTAGSGSGLAASILATIGVTVTISLLILMELILAFVILPKAFELVAKELGTDIAVALAVVMAVYAFANWDSWTFVTNLGKGSHALNLLTVATGLVNATQHNFMREFQRLQKEFDEYELLAEERMEELEAAQELLDVNNLLDPLLFTNRMEPKIVWGESPDAFYNRTIHSGNVGTKGIESIENFVDIAVVLPTANNTLKGI